MNAVLLIVLRTTTAIVVSTAAVQFWGLAFRGETPVLHPSIAFPPTATAVAAAVVPRPAPKRQAKSHARPGELEVRGSSTPFPAAARHRRSRARLLLAHTRPSHRRATARTRPRRRSRPSRDRSQAEPRATRAHRTTPVHGDRAVVALAASITRARALTAPLRSGTNLLHPGDEIPSTVRTYGRRGGNTVGEGSACRRGAARSNAPEESTSRHSSSCSRHRR